MIKNIEIDGDTADRITIANLASYSKMLKGEIKDLTKKIKDGTSYPAQAEDLEYNIKMLKAIKSVLSYFGEAA